MSLSDFLDEIQDIFKENSGKKEDSLIGKVLNGGLDEELSVREELFLRLALVSSLTTKPENEEIEVAAGKCRNMFMKRNFDKRIKIDVIRLPSYTDPSEDDYI